MTRKVLLVSNMYPSHEQITYGTFIKNIERTLLGGGFDVDKIVISGRGRSFIEKIRKYSSFYRGLFTSKTNNYDVVHISYPSHTFFPFLLKKKTTKYVVRLHGHDLVAAHRETATFRLFRRMTLMSCKKADAIIVPSHFFRQELEKYIDLSGKPILVVPSGGIDLALFTPADLRIPEERSLCFGYVGRMDERKGIALFLEAFSRQTSNCRAVLVGTGPFLSEAKAIARRLDLTERCIFTGPKPYEELPTYYNQFDVLVFPTLYRESFGNVILEAMACGLPVIVSDHGAPADFVEHGVDGLKVPPGDSLALEKTMEEFSALNQEERKRYRINCLEKARQYSTEIINEKYRNFLLSVCE